MERSTLEGTEVRFKYRPSKQWTEKDINAYLIVPRTTSLIAPTTSIASFITNRKNLKIFYKVLKFIVNISKNKRIKEILDVVESFLIAPSLDTLIYTESYLFVTLKKELEALKVRK